MSLEQILQYGLGTAIIFGLVVPLVLRLVRVLIEDRKEIVRTQERIVGVLDNHLSSIGRSLAVVEERLRLVVEAIHGDSGGKKSP